MPSLDVKLEEWERERRRLERETRLLVVDEGDDARQQLEDLIFRHHLSARFVGAAEPALELLATREYPLVLISESLPGLGGVYLLRQLRATHPEVDTMLTAWEPTLELLGKAFELRVLDVVPKPLPAFEVFGERLRGALRHSVNRRLRHHVLRQLRDVLQQLPTDARLRTTGLLERRLSAFKASLGAYNRALVVEAEDLDLRLLSEYLLLAGLHVETVPDLAEGVARVAAGDIHLLALHAQLDETGLGALLEQLHAASPLVELLLVTAHPDVARATAALQLGVASYLSWPPANPATIGHRAQEILKRARKERLMDNLLGELFRETNRALGHPRPEELFTVFRQVVGVTRIPVTPELLPSRADAVEAVEFLDEVLDALLSPEEEPINIDELLLDEALAGADGEGAERRQHLRVPESQFVRFRPRSAPASTLALLGDLSAGGLFIRSGELLLPGTFVEVDFNVEHEERAYLIRCRAQVAWVARDNRQSPLGPGFGVKFVDPPAEVAELLQHVVEWRLQQGDTDASLKPPS